MFIAHCAAKTGWAVSRAAARMLAVILCVHAVTPQAAAQAAYPAAPVRLIVSTGAGSGPDVVGRIIAEHLSKLWGQQMFVVNHPGAAGSIAMKAAGTSAPDGYTILFAQSSTFVALPEIQSKFPYDLLRDFAPIGFVGEQPIAMGVAPALGVRTLAEFIELARKTPGGVNLAVQSRGGIAHLTAEALKLASGVSMTAVNYTGAPQGLADVLGGRVQMIFDGLPGLLGNVTGGTLRLLAIGTEQRLPNFPDVPTVAETLPGFKARGFFALMAPPGTSEAITTKIGADLRKVLGDPDLVARFHQIATYPKAMTPAELVAYVREEQKLWKPVLDQVGMSAPRN